MQLKARGFTLIEVIVVMAILATLLGWVLPGFGRAIDRSRLAGIHNEFVGALAMARTEALTKRRGTLVCPLDSTSQRCRNDGDWSSGWIVFVDNNNNRALDISDRVVVLAAQTMPSSTHMYSGTFRPMIRYAPNGMSQGSNVTVRLCLGGLAQTAIVVNNAGRPRIERDPEALAQQSCPS
ncbi:MAG: GspH/FimT family pseudopilin [Pseudomarimonas sp.]